MKLAQMFKVIGFAALMIALTGFLLGAYALTEDELLKEQEAANVKGDPVGPPMTLDHGGPDGGGYYFIDSDDDANNAPVYGWIDISSNGTEIAPWPHGTVDDGYTDPIPMGMSFNFYGTAYDNIVISTNGWVSFLPATSSYLSNTTIPTASNPNAFIAVEWDDLDGGTVGHCYYYYDAANDQFIVSWVNWPYYPDASTPAHDLQVILKGNGDIIAQYGNCAGAWQTDVTVGIENETGTVGTQVAYNQAYLRTDLALYYGLTPPIYADHDVRPNAFVAPSGFGRTNTPVTPVVRFQNTGSNTESFTGRLKIVHSGEVYNQTQSITNLAPTATVDVTFPAYTPTEEGIFEFVAISELTGDGAPQNDTLRMNFQVYANIYVEDFEAGDGFFTGDNDWTWGAPTNPGGPGNAHSGTNVWAAGLAANYSIGPLLSTLISPPLGLGNGAQLSFYHWYDTEDGFDGGNVKVSADGGATWTIITPAGGYDGTLSSGFQNPIGGEEAFFDVSNGWVQATFDLSAYAGQSVLIKFDFGSDSSVDGVGWFIDDFTIIGGGGVEPGWVTGTVTDAATTLPLENAIVSVGGRRDTTGIDGVYWFELIPGSFELTASAQYHNSLTVPGVAIVEGDTTTQNFALTAPGLQVDTAPVDTFLLVGQTATFNRNITNTGNGQLDWSVEVSFGNRLLSSGVRVDQKGAPISIDEALKSEISEYSPDFTPGQPPAVLDFGDELFTFDPQTPAGDEACLGMEFDGTYFWVTGRHPSDNVHKLHKYDRNGTYITSYDQGTSSTWGWRDMAFDGTYLYASDESEFARIDPATGLRVGTLPMPSGFTPPLRGLAYDPATDHFWAANFSSNIIEFTRTGQIINSFANAKAIYGLAWDDVTTGGPFLWTFSQDGTPPIEVNQFDPVSGAYTGVTFYAIDHSGGNDDLAGGACFTTDWNPAFGVLFVLVQGQAGGVSYDLVQGYEITPYSNWLSLNPTSGTLAPAQSATLAITIDFTGPNVVADSTYHASITVRSNAQGAPVIPVTAGARTGIEDGDMGLPASYSLSQNYPNPFNGATVISFALAKDSDVRLEVFNLLGQRVETLVSSRLPAGYHTVSWSSEEAASGVYFYRLQAGDFSEVHQMTLMK